MGAMAVGIGKIITSIIGWEVIMGFLIFIAFCAGIFFLCKFIYNKIYMKGYNSAISLLKESVKIRTEIDCDILKRTSFHIMNFAQKTEEFDGFHTITSIIAFNLYDLAVLLKEYQGNTSVPTIDINDIKTEFQNRLTENLKTYMKRLDFFSKMAFAKAVNEFEQSLK